MRVEFASSEPPTRSDRRTERFESAVDRVSFTGDQGQHWSGVITDESLGGIGMVFDQRLPVHVGQELELVLDGNRMLAQVRYYAPTDTGCRIGIEWNAYCLSEHARYSKAMFDAKYGGTDDQTVKNVERLLTLLPGGIYMIWRNFECRKWHELQWTAERVSRAAELCGIDELTVYLPMLQEALEGQADMKNVRQIVQELVRDCVNVARGFAEV